MCIRDRVHAFAEDGIATNYQAGGSGPFSQCAAQDHLVEFQGDGYFNEATFASENPYVWGTPTNCTLGAQEESEVIGLSLIHI